MAYIRPCKKCGQRISLREMKAKQWVAFDASTEKPHRCGYKNKADPNIKNLAKEKFKEKDSGGVDLGYSDIESDNLSEEQSDEINSKINETYDKSSKVPPKVEEKYKKEEINTNDKDRFSSIVYQKTLEKKLQEVKNSTIPLKEIQENEEPTVQETEKYKNQGEDSKYKPRDFWWYVWRFAILVWGFVIINWILGCPFADCS